MQTNGEIVQREPGVETARCSSMLPDENTNRTIARHRIGGQVDIFHGAKCLLRWQRNPKLETSGTTAVSRTARVPRPMRRFEPLHAACGNHALRSIRVFITNASFKQVGDRYDARVGMQFSASCRAMQIEVIE